MSFCNAAKVFVFGILCSSCITTTHSSNPITMGKVSSQEAMEKIMYETFPMKLERFVMGTRSVDREALLDFESKLIEKLKIKEGREQTYHFLYRFRHMSQGTWFINSGVERAFKRGYDESQLGFFIESDYKDFKFKLDTKSIVDTSKDFRGVFFTNLGLHHLLGVPDLPHLSKLISGPGEASDKDLARYWTQSSADAYLHNKRAIRELRFGPKKQGRISVLDVFGDKSVFAVHLPGYSSGSVGYLIRTTTGPHFIVSDVSPTLAGVVHGIAPGVEAMDHRKAYASLQWLRFFIRKHPKVTYHLGRQVFPAGTKLKVHKIKPKKTVPQKKAMPAQKAAPNANQKTKAKPLAPNATTKPDRSGLPAGASNQNRSQ